MDKDKVCFIRAKLKDDYFYNAIKNMGFQIMIPYKDTNIIMRCLREIWFRLGVPRKELWFNSQINAIKVDTIIVFEPLIIPELLMWIRKKHMQARIILCYENRVEKTLNPNEVCDDIRIEKWSYDLDDCIQYQMHFMKGCYVDIYRLDKIESPKYDVVYLGRDKGRANKLLDLEKQFKNIGLKTYFYICADRQFLAFKHSYYKPLMSYTNYLKLISKSRSILNIVPEGQTSITMRDYEVVFNGIKGITNNKGIKNFNLYHPSRFFILGEEPLEKLPEFLSKPFLPISEEELEEYKFENAFCEMLKCDRGSTCLNLQ